MNFIKTFENAFDSEFCRGVTSLIDSSIEGGFARERYSPITVDSQVELNQHLTPYGHTLDIKSNYYSSIFLSKMKILIEEYLSGLQIETPATLAQPLPMNMLGQRTLAKHHGGYHQWHCETSSLETSHRALSYCLYLNDIPVGEGETEFLHQGYRQQPKMGTVVIWPAGYTHIHRGNPVHTTDKYIITGWAHHQMP